jgi:arylsulfatase A-like enzyme
MNAIVIVADSLRRDHLGCYGSPRVQTPHIDAFAREALVFEQAFSEGLPTLPTRTAMWTGRHTVPFRGWQRLEPDDIVLAEWLWDKGYTSALVTDVYHMHRPGMGYARGFDEVCFIRGQEYDPWIVAPEMDLSAGMRRHFKPAGRADRSDWFREGFRQYLRNISVRRCEEDYFVARVCIRAADWLAKMRGKDNLLLWVDCFDPHEPWDPPEEFARKYADPAYRGKQIIDPVPCPVRGYMDEAELANTMALYAGEVSFVDKWVGYLLQRAAELGYFDDSLVIFTTDHGEPFGEHGIIRKCRPWNYEELVHVPFVLRMPDGTGAGRRHRGIVQLCDIAPTIYDFLGVPHPPGETARSILPLVTGEADTIREHAFIGHHNKSWTIRDAKWSFHLDIGDTGRFDIRKDQAVPVQVPAAFGRELYDLRKDPAEQTNLAPDKPKLADELELELRRFMASLKWE